MSQNLGGKTALGLDSNVGALLCYLHIPCLPIGLVYSIIVAVAEKNNKFVRFSAFQSLLMIAVMIVFWILITIVSFALAMMSSTISLIFSLLMWVVLLGFFGLCIFLCIKAYGNQQFKLPVIGDMAEKWA